MRLRSLTTVVTAALASTLMAGSMASGVAAAADTSTDLTLRTGAVVKGAQTAVEVDVASRSQVSLYKVRRGQLKEVKSAVGRSVNFTIPRKFARSKISLWAVGSGGSMEYFTVSTKDKASNSGLLFSYPPAEVTNLRVTHDPDFLRWDRVPGATGYLVNDGSKVRFTKKVRVPAKPGMAYSVMAVNADGSSDPVNIETDLTFPNRPQPPTNLVAAAGDQSIYVSWNPSPDAATYQVGYRWAWSFNVTWTGPLTDLNHTITGLRNDRRYFVYVAAVNDAGRASSTYSSTVTPSSSVPAPVTNLTSDAGDGEVTLSWDPVANATGYQVTWTDSGSDTPSTITVGAENSPGMSQTITGLDNGRVYTFNVWASNSYGRSAAQSVTATPNAEVDNLFYASDSGVEVAGIDNGLDVSWADVPGATGYIISYGTGANGDDSSVTVDADTTGYVIADLDPNVDYYVTVTPIGAGAAVTVGPVRCALFLPAPRNVTAEASNAAALVTYSPVDKARGYTIRWKKSSAWFYRHSDRITVDAGTTRAFVTGLSNNTEYQFSVSAKGRIFNGWWGTSPDVTPNTRVPATVGPVTAVGGDASASLTWAPVDGATGYRVYTNTGQPVFARQVLAGDQVTYQVAGLTNGTRYTFDVFAVNPSGLSAPATSNPVVPGAVAPGAIDDLAATAGDASATLTFTTPSAGTGSIANFEYSLNSGPWVSLDPAQGSGPIAVSGLVNGTTYTAEVRAVNTAGVTGPVSNTATFTPAADKRAPGEPTDLSANAGDEQVTVSFTAPNPGSSAITDYEYALNGGAFVSSGTAVSPVVISGLTNGSEYDIVLRAVNADAGPGKPSSAVSATPFGVPQNATITDSSAGNASAVITFTVDDNGSAVTKVQYQLNGGDWTDAAGVTSPITITGLTNGQAYDIAIRAVNAAGASPASNTVTVTPDVAPDAPVITNATPGDGSVVVEFTEASSNVDKVQYQINDGDWTDASSTTSPITISGLTNGESYKIDVRVVSPTGVVSEPSNSVTVTPFGIPGKPSIVDDTPGNQTVSIDFTVSDGGQKLTDVEYRLGDGDWTSSGQTTSPLAIAGLVNGTEYSITVRAVNEAGPGPASDPVKATPATVPDSPTISAAAPGDGSAAVTFTLGGDGGSAVTKVQYQLNGGEWTDASGVNSPITITGLTNGQVYDITIRAVNAAGASPASNTVTVTPEVPARAPGQVRNLAATVDGTTATVTWDAPADDGGSPITRYDVSVSPQGTVTVNGTSATVTGLAAGQSTISVSATNVAGTGPAASTTVNVGPAAPTVTGSASGTTVNLSWTSVAGATGYDVFTCTGANCDPLSSTADVVTGTTYTINGSYSTTYRAAVKALVGGAAGPASNVVTVTTGSGPTPPPPPPPPPSYPPSAPLNVKAEARSGEAIITWSAPQSSGSSAIDQYRVTASNGVSQLVPANTFRLVMTGLVNGSPYTFRVAARNNAGWGPDSVASNSVTPQPPTLTISANTAFGNQVGVKGTSTFLPVGSDVIPWVRIDGQGSFVQGVGIRALDSDGSWSWQRQLGNQRDFVEVYFTVGSVRSNTLTLHVPDLVVTSGGVTAVADDDQGDANGPQIQVNGTWSWVNPGQSITVFVKLDNGDWQQGVSFVRPGAASATSGPFSWGRAVGGDVRKVQVKFSAQGTTSNVWTINLG